MVVCENPNNSTNPLDCRTGVANGDAAGLTASLDPAQSASPWGTAALNGAFPYAHSWLTGRAVNFAGYTNARSNGPFTYESAGNDLASLDIDDRTLLPGTAGVANPPVNYSRVVTGFLWVPASGSAADTLKTIAIGSDDGSFFAIQTCPQTGTGGATVCSSETPNAVVTISRINAQAFTYANSKKAIAFPSAGGLFPFQAVMYQNGGDSGFELAWASGDKSGSTCGAGNNLACYPAWSGTAWSNLGGFTLIPASSIYAPDVRATLTASVLGGGAVAASSVVTYTATVRNQGLMPAFGLVYTLALDTAVFPNPATVFVVQVNGTTVAPTVTSNATNTLVQVPFRSVGNSVDSLLDGTSATITVTAAVAAATAGGTTFYAQGRIAGHGTDPAVITGQAVNPASTLWVLTNDPSWINGTDEGNAPAGLAGQYPEATQANTQTFVSTALGNEDDNPLALKTTVHVAGAPIINAPTNPVSALSAITVGGNVNGRSGTTVRVRLSNSAQSLQSFCTAAGWSWDAAAGFCTCWTASIADDGSWSCGAIALPHCTAAGSCTTATAQVASQQTGDTVGVPFSYAFRVSAPTVTITTPAASPSLKSHIIAVAGTASDGIGGDASTSTINVSITGAGPGSCAPTVAVGGGWSCSIPVIADGNYFVSASIAEATTNNVTVGPNPFSVDTHPSMNALPAFTNNVSPALAGGRIGDGPTIRVCPSPGPCTTVQRICDDPAPSAGSWSCAHTFGAGSYTLVAYELDAANNLSAPSSPARSMTVNTTRPTLDSFPAGKIFNVANNPGTVGGTTCATGQTVTATLLTVTGATCSATCTAGQWSCAIPVSASTQLIGLSMRVAESGSDGVALAMNPDLGGFQVQTKVPNAPVVTINSLIGGTSPNPPPVPGSGAAGNSVAVAIKSGATTLATCNTTVGGGGTWTCSSWTPSTPLADGNYTASATQTDAFLNVSAPGTKPFQVRFAPPAAPVITMSALIGGTSSNPPPVTGTGETGNSVAVSIKSGATTVATCNTTVGGGGSWSCSSWTPSTALPDGSYTASATQTNGIPNTSAPGTKAFQVDFTPPLAPLVAVLSAPAGFTPSRTPAITATPSKSGGTVTVVVTSGGTTVGTCSSPVASPPVAVSCSLTASLADGTYAVSATQTDPAGNVSPAGAASFAVDGTTSPVPLLTSPTSPTLTHQPVLSGTGYPGSTVTVTDQSGNVICTATVATTPVPGPYAWTCTPATALADSDFVLSVAGGAPNGTGASGGVALQVRSFPAPVLDGPASTTSVRPSLTISGGAAGQIARVTEGGSLVCSATVGAGGAASCAGASWLAPVSVGDHVFVAELRDGATPPHRSLPSAAKAVAVLPSTPLLASGTFGTNQPLLQGSGATAGAAITFKDAGGNLVCAATAAADGSVSCQVSGAVTLPDGADSLTITATSGGKTSSAVASVNIRATPDLVPLTTPTRDAQPQICVAPQVGVPDGTVATVLDGLEALCSSTLSAGAAQACCRPAQPLSDGAHPLMARLRFPPGGSSALSAPFTVTIKTKTTTPVLLLASGATLSGPISITGTAEAGASVVVTIDGQALPAVITDASGTFTVDAGVRETGGHLALAVATDQLGNQATSDPRSFTVVTGGHIEGSALGCSSGGSAGWTLFVPLVALALRRRRAVLAVARKKIIIFLSTALALGAAAARADDLGLDHFRPASGSDGAIGTEGARPPVQGEPPLEVHLWGVGQNRPLVFVPDSGGRSTALIRNRVGGWLGAQVHLSGPLSASLQVPFLVGQNGDLSPMPPNLTQGANLAAGFGDLRATARLALLRQERARFDLAAQASIELPTARQGAFLGDQNPHGEALVAAGRRFDLSRGAIDLLGNLYLRIERARQVMDVKAGSQLGMRGAVAWLPGSLSRLAPRRVLLELEGASFMRAGFARGSVPAEWRAGVEYCLGPVVFDLGAGGGLSKGIGTPGFRIVGGVGFAPSACGSGLARVAPPPLAVAEAVRPPPPPVKPPPPKEQPRVVAAPPPPAPELPLPPLVKVSELPPPPPKAMVAEPPLVLPELPLVPLPAKPEPKPKSKKRTIAKAPEAPGLELVPLLPQRQATLEGERITLSRPLVFVGSQLLPASRALLDDVALVLREHPEVKTLLIAAPDRAKAEAIVASLRKKGVQLGRLEVAPEPTPQVELRVVRR
jgi:hypothetical protein